MSKYSKIQLKGKTKNESGVLITGWMLTDSILNVSCPRCNAPKEHYCQYPKNRKKSKPHVERCKIFMNLVKEKRLLNEYRISQLN